ncbi:MAG TPA: UDP-glucose 4-epimerase GalE [Bryobacteraceae bacterium]|nr:UDP-glucose 4-epimerase GalE [Bryobacteraceae bacterium]
MARILVTGGAGYIGSITTRHLLDRGYDVVVVDDLSRGHRHSVPPERLRVVSLQDAAELAPHLAGVDAVIHFAGYIAVGESTREPELYFSNNVGGTLALFAAMADAGVRRMVFSSTAAVYGNPKKTPIPEEEPFAPVSPYGESKTTVERMLHQLDLFRGLRSVALRYFNACGAEPSAGLGEEHEPETHLIPLLLRAIKTGEPIQIFGTDYPTPDGTCVRDYIHVSDLAEAHLAALEHLMNGGGSNAFNVGTGSGYSVMEVLRAVEEVTGHKVPYTIAPRREGDAAELVADSTKLRKTLGWQPRRSDLRDIVKDAWAFFNREVPTR